MARSAGLVVRVVPVRGVGASDARRRVVDVLLRAAIAKAPPELPEPSADGSPDSPSPRFGRGSA